MTLRILCTLAAAAFIAGASAAAEYRVAPDGDDSGPGSAEAPWATLQHAVDTAEAGDTITVADGEYRGFRITRSGLPGKPVTLRAENRQKAVVRGVGEKCARDAVIEINAFDDSSDRVGYWVLEGLDVDGAGSRNCIRPSVTTHTTVKDCRLRDSEWVCIMSGHSDYMVLEGNLAFGSKNSHGIYMANSADNGVLRANRSHSNGKAGIHMNGDLSCGGDGVMTGWLVEENVCWNNGLVAGGGAINCDGVSDSVFRNNLLYGNHRTGMTFYAIDASEGSSRNLIANNTVVMADDAFAVVIMPLAKNAPSPAGNRFYNNILIAPHPAKPAFVVGDPKAAGFESDYNVISGIFQIGDEEVVIGLDEWRKFGHDAHSIVASPEDLFAAPGEGDYHLKGASPAIDAGTALTDLGKDIEGKPRPQGPAYDIGCYEAPEGD